jgi:Ca-activated chloride channel family protein
MKYAVPAFALAVVCSFPPSLQAQTRQHSVYVSVVDSKGDPATGLTVNDLRVREDGVVREVLKVAPATEPLTVALLVDDSQATQNATQFIREAVDDFITALAGKGELSISTFGERPTLLADYTTDTVKLKAAAKRIFPRQGAGAYLMDAIVEVSRGFQKREATRGIIAVLTIDDEVEFSNRNFENVLSELQKGRAALHVISLGSPSNSLNDEMRNRNQSIAEGTERTGGRRDNVLALMGAASRMKQLAAELINQYQVTYARPDTLIPPDKLEVTATKPGLTLRAPKRTGQPGAKK